jgi:hypothetical protein|tara:strand:- start:463 stop:594 length:132 start_codon:yes stop_codon:yes gene_type:complete
LLDDFISRAIGRREVELPREQVQLMALIEAAYQAADSGREVEL